VVSFVAINAHAFSASHSEASASLSRRPLRGLKLRCTAVLGGPEGINASAMVDVISTGRGRG